MYDEMLRYREAYPELDIELVGRGRGARSGPRRVTWYNDQRDVAGTGELRWLEGAEFLISCDVLPHQYIDQSQKVCRIRYAFFPRGLHNYSTCAHYPVCAKLVTKLFMKDGDWACSDCQGSRYRSTSIPPQQRWSEEIDHLHGETKEGRPFGMCEVTYLRKLYRLRELRAKRIGERVPPPARFRFAIYAKWDKREQDSADERQ